MLLIEPIESRKFITYTKSNISPATNTSVYVLKQNDHVEAVIYDAVCNKTSKHNFSVGL